MLLPLLNVGCKHQNGPKENGPEVLVAEIGQGERLTEEGENLQAVFSSDGQRILYISRNRADHRNAQAYEKNLGLSKENRITFQNGEVSNPRYILDQESILYASSTDELKENSPFLREKLKQEGPSVTLPPELQAPSEIYLHKLDGGGMRRLTTHSGFDGWPIAVTKDRFAWTELEKNFLRVRTMSLSREGETVLTQLPANSSQYSPSPAPKSKDVAWISFNDDFKSSHLWLQRNKNRQELAIDLVGLKTDLSWDSSGNTLLFAFQKIPDGAFEIYSINTDGSCLTRQTRNKARERYPSLSPDGSSLIYSSDAKKGWQIYRRPWTRPCPTPVK